jgi:hypothetical protein
MVGFEPNLEPEQKDLLSQLVEATRSVPRTERRPFMYIRFSGGEAVQGNRINIPVLGQDLDVLMNNGLIALENYHTKGTGYNFYVPPDGFAYYEDLKRESGEPAIQIETEVTHYLDAEAFQAAYPDAYARWREAADLLWQTDSEQQLSTIGLKCRESVQAFATALIEKHGVPDANPDKAATRDRLSAVITARRPDLGEARSELLDALFNYWRAAGDLIQRQTHAGQREGEPLTWEDGRRVVFQTAVLMFEVDKTLS